MCFGSLFFEKKMTLEKNCAVWICADSFFDLCIMEVEAARLPLFCVFSQKFVSFVHKSGKKFVYFNLCDLSGIAHCTSAATVAFRESLKVFNKKGSIESASNFSTKAVESKKKNLIKEEVLN